MKRAINGRLLVKIAFLTKVRLLTSLGLLSVLLIGLSFTLNNTQAASVTWDVDNSAYTNDTNCTTSLHQCKSIKAAVAAASPGDIINVAHGMEGYDGFNVTTPDLAILGPNASFNPVTGSRSIEAQIITGVSIQPSATGVTVQGFEFNRSDSRIDIKANNFTLKNNIFSGFLSPAVSVTGPISNLAIEANLIPVVGVGITVSQVTIGHITGNTIGNTSTYIDTGIILDAITDFQVSENNLTYISNQAILLTDTSSQSSNVTITDNNILRANNSAVVDQGAIQFYGDNLNSPNPLTITNNIFQTSRNGIVLETGGTTSGNTLINNNCFSNTISTYGDLYNGGTGLLEAVNNFSGGTAPTVAGSGPVTVTPYLPADAITLLTNPSIEGNTAGQSVALGQIKNSNGDNVANLIVGYRFLTNPGSNPVEGLLTSDSNGILRLTLSQAVSLGNYDLVLNPTTSNVAFPVKRQGCHSAISLTLKVTPPCTVNSDGGAGYSTIEAALASPCSVIRVTGGGPYRTSLVIDHPVILKGPNAGINPNTQTRNPEVSVYLTDGFNDPTDILNRGTIVRLTSSNVTIDGFTLDGNNPFTGSGVLINGEDVNAAYGLTNRNSSGLPLGLNNVTIQNNIFKNFNVGAVRLDGISTVVSDNYFQYNKVDNVFPVTDDGYGVLLGDNFYAEIAGNSMSRVRQGIKIKGFNLDNPGSTASIFDNTIDSYQTGVWYDSSQGFTISGNTLQGTLPGNTNTGLWLTNLQASPAVTISNNTITGGEAGVKAWGTASLKISGGSITGANYGVYLHNYQPGGSPAIPGIDSNLTLDGLTISDSNMAGVYLFDNTANASNALTLLLEGGSQLKNGMAGIIVAGQDTTLQLADTAFSGQSGDYITLDAESGDGLPGNDIDARAATFEGISGTSLDADQYSSVQAKLTDRYDTPALGMVILYNPVLAISNSTLNFIDKVGGSNPVSQSLTISNPVVSAASLQWALVTPDYGSGSPGWLDCTPTQGVLELGASDQIHCQATTGSLANGIYTATLSVTSPTPGVQSGSQPVTITFMVAAPPVIVTQPASQNIVSGQTVSLSVSATSLAPLTFQWYEGTTENDSTAVGTDMPQFTSPPITSSTSYWVKVSNFAGSVSSNLANITICNDFVVDKTFDTGAGTLCGTFSYSLKQASLATQPVTITFAPGVSAVTINGPLAAVSNTNQMRITIDGGCNNQGVPVVSLLAGTGSSSNGLNLAGHTTVNCLIVTGFSGYAISMQGDDNQLQSSWLGTLDGLTGSGTGGGLIISGNNNSLGQVDNPNSGNRIFGNNSSGIEVTSGQGNTAYYNQIASVKAQNLTLPANVRAVYIAAGGQLKFGRGNQIRVITLS